MRERALSQALGSWPEEMLERMLEKTLEQADWSG